MPPSSHMPNAGEGALATCHSVCPSPHSAVCDGDETASSSRRASVSNPSVPLMQGTATTPAARILFYAANARRSAASFFSSSSPDDFVLHRLLVTNLSRCPTDGPPNRARESRSWNGTCLTSILWSGVCGGVPWSVACHELIQRDGMHVATESWKTRPRVKCGGHRVIDSPCDVIAIDGQVIHVPRVMTRRQYDSHNLLCASVTDLTPRTSNPLNGTSIGDRSS